ncbi:lipase family protein [Nocardioides antri]|uniref:lipase family protein n=1 Tax=Nocardioides antri TaxID=2607659 RepID=UPI0034CE66C8
MAVPRGRRRREGRARRAACRAELRGAGLADSPIGMWGYSGGAFATANAAQLQPRYAPELDIDAVALGGLLGSVRKTIDAFSGSVVGGAIPMGIHGLDRSYARDLRSYLNAFGRREYDASADLCIFEAVQRRPFLDISDIEAFPGALDRPEISAMLAENSPVNRLGVPTAPVYEYHARYDQMAPVRPARAVLRNYCRAGAVVEYREALAAEHLSEMVLGAPGAVAFLDRMFQGRAPVDRCGAIPR